MNPSLFACHYFPIMQPFSCMVFPLKRSGCSINQKVTKIPFISHSYSIYIYICIYHIISHYIRLYHIISHYITMIYPSYHHWCPIYPNISKPSWSPPGLQTFQHCTATRPHPGPQRLGHCERFRRFRLAGPQILVSFDRHLWVRSMGIYRA